MPTVGLGVVPIVKEKMSQLRTCPLQRPVFGLVLFHPIFCCFSLFLELQLAAQMSEFYLQRRKELHFFGLFKWTRCGNILSKCGKCLYHEGKWYKYLSHFPKVLPLVIHEEKSHRNVFYAWHCWYWSLSGYYKQPKVYLFLYTVSRCRTRGESQEFIPPGFETQGRCCQKSKTGISVAPWKGLVSSKHFLKKKSLFVPLSLTPHLQEGKFLENCFMVDL